MATLALQVGSGNDDGREPGSGTPILNDANEIIMIVSSINTWAAMRFTNVTVPQGSTINTFTHSIYVNSTTYDTADLNVYLENADNSAALTTSSNNISGRSLTSAVIWTATNMGTGWKSPGDLASQFQTVVNRVGWVSGNAATVLFKARSGTNELRWRPYEYDSSLAAKIDIDYTAPGGASHVVSKVSRVRLVSKVGGGLAWCI